jgi:hypothetical protein
MLRQTIDGGTGGILRWVSEMWQPRHEVRCNLVGTIGIDEYRFDTIRKSPKEFSQHRLTRYHVAPRAAEHSGPGLPIQATAFVDQHNAVAIRPMYGFPRGQQPHVGSGLFQSAREVFEHQGFAGIRRTENGRQFGTTLHRFERSFVRRRPISARCTRGCGVGPLQRQILQRRTGKTIHPISF